MGRLLWLLAVLLLPGCGRSAPAQEPAQAPPVRVVVAKAVQRTVPITGEYIAHTAALATVDIKARAGGMLTGVHFAPGDYVSAGQLLFTIQPDEYEASLQSAQAMLDKASADLYLAKSDTSIDVSRSQLAQERADLEKSVRNLARYRPLAAERAVTQVDLDSAIAAEQVAQSKVAGAQTKIRDGELQQRVAIAQAQADVEQHAASLRKAQLNLSYTQIRSPVSGIIGFLKIDKGNVVGSDSPPLATVSTIDPMRVLFSVSEVEYLDLIHRLQDEEETRAPELPLQLILADNSVYPFEGHPKSLDRAVDPKTGTIAIEGLFPNPPGRLGILRPGLFGRVRITLGFDHDAVLVPQRAVTPSLGSNTVYVVRKDNKVSLRTIGLGRRVGSDYIVASGLRAGETVVVEGTQKVQPGSAVIATAPASSEK